MLEQLIGRWKNESAYGDTRTESEIVIDNESRFVTRMDYRMPTGRQIVEHHGTVEVEPEWFRVNLEKGYTQEFSDDGIEAGPLRDFTKSEYDETLKMLSQKIAYQITPEDHLKTEVQGPSGGMTIVYTRCNP